MVSKKLLIQHGDLDSSPEQFSSKILIEKLIVVEKLEKGIKNGSNKVSNNLALSFCFLIMLLVI